MIGLIETVFLSNRTEQDRTCNTHRAELIENGQMVYPIKSCTEVNRHDPSLLSTLKCTLRCMGHAQNYITDTQTFPISKLGGWKDTTAFLKSSKTNRHQALKHLRQYRCYGNWSVIGNRRGRCTLRNWGDISLSPASRETTQTNKPLKHYSKTGGHNISSSLKGTVPAENVFLFYVFMQSCIEQQLLYCTY